MAAPPASPSTGSASSPDRLPSGTRPSRLRFVAVACAVAIVLIVLFAALGAAGVIPKFWSPSPSAAVTAVPYSVAVARAQTAADAYGGGSWMLWSALGYLNTTGFSVPTAQVAATGGEGCEDQHTVYPTNNVSTPAIANMSQGLSEGWLFEFENGSGSGFLLVAVQAGVARPIASFWGNACPSPASLAPPITSPVVDSPDAAEVAGAAGVYGYLAGHPRAYGQMALRTNFNVGENSTVVLLPLAWEIAFADCTIRDPSTGFGTAILAFVNATSGELASVTPDPTYPC